jgi:hypothetical protein
MLTPPFRRRPSSEPRLLLSAWRQRVVAASGFIDARADQLAR